MEQWGLVDTLIWASFFSKPNAVEKRAVDELIDADRVVLIGPTVAEVLREFRRKSQADWLPRVFNSSTTLSLPGMIGNAQRKPAVTLPQEATQCPSPTWWPPPSLCERGFSSIQLIHTLTSSLT